MTPRSENSQRRKIRRRETVVSLPGVWRESLALRSWECVRPIPPLQTRAFLGGAPCPNASSMFLTGQSSLLDAFQCSFPPLPIHEC